MIRGAAGRRLLFRGTLFVVDGVCLLAALRLAHWTRFEWAWFVERVPLVAPHLGRASYVAFEWAALGVWWGSFLYSGFYGRINRRSSDEFLRVVRGVALGWILILAGTVLFRRVGISRLFLGLSAVYAAAGVYIMREAAKFIYRRTLARWGGRTRVLVLGTGHMAKSIQRVLGHHPELAIISGSARTPEELARLLVGKDVREIYVGESNLSHSTLVAMVDIADEAGVPLRIVPDVLELRMGEVQMDDSLGLPTFQVKPAALHGWTYVYKRVFDLLFSLTVLTVGFLPLALVAALIKIDSPGPVLFRQKRVGLRGSFFHVLKFRTMTVKAESMLDTLLGKTEQQRQMFKLKNDPRVTRVGRWLRRLSIDEIPQFVNVLRGEMSVIGPRPLPASSDELKLYHAQARRRMNVLPGLTGFWQVNGRSDLSFDEMVELDLYYIEHWSPGLDLKILLQTVPAVFGSRGAY